MINETVLDIRMIPGPRSDPKKLKIKRWKILCKIQFISKKNNIEMERNSMQILLDYENRLYISASMESLDTIEISVINPEFFRDIKNN